MKYAFHPALADRNSDPDHPAAGALHAPFLGIRPPSLHAETGRAFPSPESPFFVVIAAASEVMLRP
jgi:hypothetical protein